MLTTTASKREEINEALKSITSKYVVVLEFLISTSGHITVEDGTFVVTLLNSVIKVGVVFKSETIDWAEGQN